MEPSEELQAIEVELEGVEGPQNVYPLATATG